MKLLVVSNGFPPRGGLGTEFYTAELVRGLAARGHEVHVLHPERDGARPRYALERVDEGGVPIWLLANPGDPGKAFASSYRDAEVERVFDAWLERERPALVHFTYLLWGLSVRLPTVARARGVPAVATLTDYGLLCHRGQMFDQRLERCSGPHPPEVCARCIREPAPFDHGALELAGRRALVRLLAPLGGLGRVVVPRDLRAREAAVRETFRDLGRLIAPTRSLLEVFARGGAPREKLVPLVYSFDEAPYREARREALRAPPQAKTRFGFLGQFAPHKGLGLVLAAVRELARLAGDADWELVLHGGPSPGRHARYAGSVLAGVDPARVRLERPFAPGDAPRVLSGFSALLAPSQWDENAPLSVLQARALGLPVIASDVPGIAEILPSGTGRLVPAGDEGALVRAMLEVVRAGTRPLESVPAGLPLSLEAHLDRLESLYAELGAEGS